MTDPEETLGASGAGIKVGGFVDFVAWISHSVFDKVHSQVSMRFVTFFFLQGYLKVDITVLGKGDPAKVRCCFVA